MINCAKVHQQYTTIQYLPGETLKDTLCLQSVLWDIQEMGDLIVKPAQLVTTNLSQAQMNVRHVQVTLQQKPMVPQHQQDAVSNIIDEPILQDFEL